VNFLALEAVGIIGEITTFRVVRAAAIGATIVAAPKAVLVGRFDLLAVMPTALRTSERDAGGLPFVIVKSINERLELDLLFNHNCIYNQNTF
jgi:hypothetical protein